jgi:2-methylcitrate dehydratase PrpD
MSKSLGVGNAAKNGLAAALLAEGGFSGPEKPIEGRYGFAAVTSDSADLAHITDGIGERWEVLNNAYKPYPCGVVLFPVIDACLELRARHAPVPEAIDRVVVRGHPLMRERTDRPNGTPARKRRDPPEIGATGEEDRQTEQDDLTQQTEGQTQGQTSASASAGDRVTNPQRQISL